MFVENTNEWTSGSTSTHRSIYEASIGPSVKCGLRVEVWEKKGRAISALPIN